MLLNAFAAVAEPLSRAYLPRPTLPDGDDDMVLEAAMNGRAEVLGTFNLSDFQVAAGQFGIAVLSQGEAVKRLEKRS